jgi:hypothetical protein
VASLDLDAIARAAADQAAERVLRELPAALRRVLDERAKKLEPLAEILSIGRDAARKRLARDHELRALGVVVGRQWKGKRSVVEAHLAARGGVR